MRVLIAFNDYLQAGGERFSVATQVDALRAHGVEVELFQVDNTQLAAGGVAGRVRSILGDPEVARELSARIVSFKPDVCHAENLFPRLGSAAIEAVAEHHVPWVRTFRNYRLACVDGSMRRDGGPCTQCVTSRSRLPGVIHRCYHGSLQASLGATVQVSRDARSMRAHAPAAHIFISDHLRRSLEGSLPVGVPGHVVPNAVDLDPAGARPWAERRVDAAYVGRLSHEKGLPLVMDAARALPDRSFAIVGVGPLSAQVEAQARELSNVEVLGHVDHARVAQVLGDAKVVMVPSQWDEPFGRVSIEAQRFGAVPLVSARGGLPETLPAGLRDALVVRGSEAQDWAAALSAVLAWTPAQAGRFASAAAATWESEHSPHALASRLTGIYEAARER